MRIFVSYSRRDLEAVDRLAGRLEAAGHSVWIDRKDMAVGDQWRLQIVEAIESADAFLVTLSPSAAQSVNVRKELDLAESAGVKVIPLIIEPVAIPAEMKYQLAGLQRVNLAEGYDDGFKRLLAALGPAVAERLPRSALLAFEETLPDSDSRWTAPLRALLTAAPDGETGIWRKDGKEMVRVPAGKFLFGDRMEEKYLPEYWIDKAPVTNAEFARFVVATGHEPPKHWKGRTPPNNISSHPVVYVSWRDAATYAEWSGKQLPREEEWEKAARGTDGRAFPWGDKEPTKMLLNFDENVGTTTPVGHYSPQGDSPYGCVDMSGNVWEWIDSWYEGDQRRRSIRGGSLGMDRNYAHAATIGGLPPEVRHDDLGFREVVRRVSSE